jgi:hypothetical protein
MQQRLSASGIRALTTKICDLNAPYGLPISFGSVQLWNEPLDITLSDDPAATIIPSGTIPAHQLFY